jgi:[acyl-carrier-protein] S-malonyltransferase
MQNACQLGTGGMAACLNISIAELEDVIQDSKNYGQCNIANDNSLDQIVISGHIQAIDQIIAELKSRGKKAIKLNVSAPFHSPLMEKAAEVMDEYLNHPDIQINNPLLPIIDNTTLQWLYDNKDIKPLLINQITGRVRWRETMELLNDQNFLQVIEFGPSPVLSKINQRSGYKFMSITLASAKDMDLYLEEHA